MEQPEILFLIELNIFPLNGNDDCSWKCFFLKYVSLNREIWFLIELNMFPLNGMMTIPGNV